MNAPSVGDVRSRLWMMKSAGGAAWTTTYSKPTNRLQGPRIETSLSAPTARNNTRPDENSRQLALLVHTLHAASRELHLHPQCSIGARAIEEGRQDKVVEHDLTVQRTEGEDPFRRAPL